MSQESIPGCGISPFLKLMNKIPGWMAEHNIGKINRQILVLETQGRRSGKPHKVPLGWVELEDRIYVVAARGRQTDWLRNALAGGAVRITRAGRTTHIRPQVVADLSRKEAVVRAYVARYPQAADRLFASAGSADPAVAAQRVGILDVSRRH